MTLARTMKQSLLLSAILLMVLITNGCFLQPINKIEREFNFIDMDAPMLRLARPVKAYLLTKDKNGKWVPVGKGIIPAGAYIKGKAPNNKITESE